MAIGYRALLGAGAVIAVLFAAGCGGGAPAPELVAQGQDDFRKTCATCHGTNAEGMPRLGKNLHQNEFVRGKSDQELLDFLKVGRPADHPLNERGVDMPPKGGNPAITEAQLTAIVAYMRSIQ